MDSGSPDYDDMTGLLVFSDPSVSYLALQNQTYGCEETVTYGSMLQFMLMI
jgi:hypothetical protein